ncbi:hopanoid-associated sugar epimerase [Hyphomicrobium denitrificans ATCC 51888]|uniref:Hopanoid-associated sugar epimerase n=1 Tax=Hyphomicrobium denitrificans (strain ATCC 51888 / DSM 1869 / NCIMB 11706 / TK 0415) TaxID=582899 RepID=D8JS34_HYPDA|nr:hopanoid-associated sugar epimerase [Hyphomicrobium denitrificans]ADJ22293.1 hopanoid-associated sugar epimerase [Hyphomicrobium denitrificans ATCC 51888]
MSEKSDKGIAFLTGASGFVGSAVARLLLDEGFAVRALVRRSSNPANLGGLGLDVVEGDIRDADLVRQSMRDVRCVFHVAADYRLWAPDPNEIIRTNVDGTRAVMEAALANGVERIVYTSSVATLRPSDDGTPVDEQSPLAEAEAIGAYKKSKVLAERLVERYVAKSKLPAVIVNPSTPIGPRDVRPTPTGRIVIEAACGRMPAYVDTGLNLVHVDDVAAGHLAALLQGRIGERYILGGDDMTLGQMLAEISRLAGRRAPTTRLPRQLVYPIAYGAEAAARITGREPFATVDGIRMAKYKMYFSSAKAKRELSYRSRPAQEALADAYDWFRAAGYLK